MHAVGLIKKLDKLGRLVIPIEIRDRLGLDEDSKLELFVNDEEKTLVMKKYKRGCDFCGEMKDNIEYKGKKVCESCAEDLEDLFDQAEKKEKLF